MSAVNLSAGSIEPRAVILDIRSKTVSIGNK
jgi:hypothetical protein